MPALEVNILFVIVFFCLVFYVTLNSRNTKLITYRVHWGFLDIQIALHVKLQGNVATYFIF